MSFAKALELVRRYSKQALARLLQRLTNECERLRARVRELEGLLAKATPQPTTPSGAIPPYQKKNVLTRRKGKKPGREKGHAGAGRKNPARIDGTDEHHLSVCPDCQGTVKELPNPRRRVIQGVARTPSRAVLHLIHRAWCRRCRKIVEPRVTAALPKAMISLETVVEAAWLHYVVGVSLSNLVRHYGYRGLVLTAGGLTQSFAKLAATLIPAYEQILKFVRNAAVLGADETGWRIGGVTYWLWYFGTRHWSYYVIDRSRGTQVVNRMLGSILSGILVCDFWGAYNALKAMAKQRCLFHLFTELSKVDLRNKSRPWARFRKKLYRILRDAAQLADRHARYSPEVYARRKKRIHARLDELIVRPVQDKDARRLIKRLKRHRQELFTFLDHPDKVSAYNNYSEQQMRVPVIVRRISHGNRSESGALTQAVLMSLFRSMHLQGKDPIEAVLQIATTALAGQPILLENSDRAATPPAHPVETQATAAPESDASAQVDAPAAGRASDSATPSQTQTSYPNSTAAPAPTAPPAQSPPAGIVSQTHAVCATGSPPGPKTSAPAIATPTPAFTASRLPPVAGTPSPATTGAMTANTPPSEMTATSPLAVHTPHEPLSQIPSSTPKHPGARLRTTHPPDADERHPAPGTPAFLLHASSIMTTAPPSA